ncbi:MAG: hypothetical protein K2N84_05990 [Clostridia bacterium]|nr:hypothetical protein [Clostridia bacterium]
MNTKTKIIKTAKICSIVCKVLYCLACAACIAFVVLAIALSCTHAIKSLTVGETAILFATLALYSFMLVGLLWNVERIFVNIEKEQTPFCERAHHYLKKVGIFLLLTATVPALVGTTLLHTVTPATELNFPIDLGGIIAGTVLLIFRQFVTYGKELEDKNASLKG